MSEMIDANVLREKYLRDGMLPTIFCNGCGHGNAIDYTLWAIEQLGINLDDVALASGIGCSSRIPGYINADGLHTTHGRAIAFATGIKAANPDLHVIVFTGDGDGTGIGGNHFIHAARRNIDLTVILLNNFTYGMTGGQLAPTAPKSSIATTAPYGNIEGAFNICELAQALGAAYVARWPIFYPSQPINSIKEGLQTRGFSLIELMSPCPTAYGRRNKLGKIDALWTWYEDNTMLIEEFENVMNYGTDEEKEMVQNKIKIGVFQKSDKPGFFEEYEKLVGRIVEKDDMKFRGGIPVKQEVRICGFGGQGVILAGFIIGKAACVFGDFNAVQSQSYGPEARGGAARSEVIISDKKIGYPRPTGVDLLVAIAQEAFDTYRGDAREDTIIIVDPDLVPRHDIGRPLYKVQVQKIAQDLGNKIVTNIAMVGAIAGIYDVLSKESMKKAVIDSVPKRFIDLNVNAFEKGYEAGKNAKLE